MVFPICLICTWKQLLQASMHTFDWIVLPFLDKYNQTGHVLTFYKHFNYYFKYRDTVSYRDIYGSDTQYYYLVVSHIPSKLYVCHNRTVLNVIIKWLYTLQCMYQFKENYIINQTHTGIYLLLYLYYRTVLLLFSLVQLDQQLYEYKMMQKSLNECCAAKNTCHCSMVNSTSEI